MDQKLGGLSTKFLWLAQPGLLYVEQLLSASRGKNFNTPHLPIWDVRPCNTRIHTNSYTNTHTTYTHMQLHRLRLHRLRHAHGIGHPTAACHTLPTLNASLVMVGTRMRAATYTRSLRALKGNDSPVAAAAPSSHPTCLLVRCRARLLPCRLELGLCV